MKYFWSNYNHIFKRESGVILFNSSTNALYQLDNNMYDEILKKGMTVEKSQLEEWELKGKIFVKNINEERDNYMNARVRGRDQNVLDLYIYPTLNCNFHCSYCYQKDFPKATMTPKIMDLIVDFIRVKIKATEIKRVALTWIGGEPLMAKDLIKKLYVKIKTGIDSLGSNIDIENFIVTNGFLMTEDVILDLFNYLDFGFVQITLDGMSNTHNNRRSDNNSDSFNTILFNIDSLLKLRPKTDLTIRCNIDKTNIDDFPLLYNDITKRHLDKNIKIVPGFVEDYSLHQNCNNENLMNKVEQGEYIVNLFKEHNIKGTNFLPEITAYSCMAKIKNSFAIGPDGYVYKCATLVGQKQFSVFHLSSTENLNTDFLNDFYGKYDYLSDKECLDCSFFPVCNGGCSVHRLKEKYLNKSVEKCPSSKICLENYLVCHIKEKFNEDV